MDASDTAGDADMKGDEPVSSGSDLSGETELPATLGADRPAAVHLPDDYSAAKPWPLLILLHGYGVTGFIQDIYLGLSARVDKFGFIEVVPEGTLDAQGHQFWNATPACCNFGGMDVDDVAYLTGLIDEASAVFNVDPGRVYLVGHSNGGFMSHIMACESSEKVTAIAVIAGSMPKDEGSCKPSKPVTVLQIHGTMDDDILYEGKNKPIMGYPGAEEAVDRWRSMDGCSLDPVKGGSYDYDEAVDGAETASTVWTDCDGGARVDLWKMEGSAHIPTFTGEFKDDWLAYLMAVDRD